MKVLKALWQFFSINDQTEPQHPQHLQRLLTQSDL